MRKLRRWSVMLLALGSEHSRGAFCNEVSCMESGGGAFVAAWPVCSLATTRT